MVAEIRENAGLSVKEIAQLTGAGERQVRNWTSGHHAPRPPARERLLELHYLVGLLRDVYTRQGAEIWLHGRKRSLDGRRPIELIANGDYPTVLDAIERLRAGAM
jgi:transcriptional regulator with XRE-family HTH domain